MKLRLLLIPLALILAGCTDRDQPTIHDYAQSAYKCLQEVNTENPIFQGCIDWGSAVAAHWAVLRYGRMEGLDKPMVQATLQRLDDPETLLTIRDHLRRHPRFEMPYGRAWLLALVREYQAITGKDTFDALADYVQRSLLSYYTNTRPDPLRTDHESDSWALVQLYLYYDALGDEEMKSWVSQKVRAHFTDYKPKAALARELAAPDPKAYDAVEPGFFSTWGNWAYLLAQVDPSLLERWLDAQTIPDDALATVTKSYTDHHLGMNHSRAWGLWWAYHTTEEWRFRSAYDAHVEQGFTDFKQHNANYWAYAHWAPQLGIYALTQPWAERRNIR